MKVEVGGVQEAVVLREAGELRPGRLAVLRKANNLVAGYEGKAFARTSQTMSCLGAETSHWWVNDHKGNLFEELPEGARVVLEQQGEGKAMKVTIEQPGPKLVNGEKLLDGQWAVCRKVRETSSYPQCLGKIFHRIYEQLICLDGQDCGDGRTRSLVFGPSGFNQFDFELLSPGTELKVVL